MKKRVIISIAVILSISLLLLIFAIFKLYIEAEKVQRNIFTSEVITTGNEVVDRIDALLKEDTLPVFESDNTLPDSTSPVLFQKNAKKFILDPSRLMPIGVVKSTINYLKNDVIITEYDTIYFDTTYNKSFSLTNTPWESDLPAEEIKKIIASSGFNIDLIEMDSNTRKLLNADYLHRIIKETLVKQKINADFDFALYNSFTSNFVVLPQKISPNEILKSTYIFSLKSSDRFSTSHYLVLHFMNERGVFLKRMWLIITLIALFLLISVSIVVYIFRMLFRQKRIAEIKNDFINNITHEFKTPISTISLACEVLNDSNMLANEEIRSSYISIIEDENDRLKKMVDNILQLAQLKKGQLPMSIEKFDIHTVINHVCDIFSLQISTKNGSIIKELHADNSIIFADITHIENILINLIDNAVKYSTEKPKIIISTHGDKKHITISIADNGIGISPKNQKKIFEDFYRESSGNVHNTKGHGLGLYYVKQIIELHGGTISVESKENQGSKFIISLPYKK